MILDIIFCLKSNNNALTTFFATEWNNREDARTTLPNEQMRPTAYRYPVDRYLAESSKNINMANIIDNDLWKSEPALRPEDEILLRKLREMLQSTADDLKLLSAEFSRNHEPATTTLHMPLDEEFNEKIHIEEVVKAKFNGRNRGDLPAYAMARTSVPDKNITTNMSSTKNYTVSSHKKTPQKKLSFSRTKVIEIYDRKKPIDKNSAENEITIPVVKPLSTAVAYNEVVYETKKLRDDLYFRKSLQVQEMPSINIRCELKTQKVLQLDILPNSNDSVGLENKRNVAVLAVCQEDSVTTKEIINPNDKNVNKIDKIKGSKRIVSKMSTCESSESSNNYNYDNNTKYNLKLPLRRVLKKTKPLNKQTEKSIQESKNNLDDWRKKLNAVYGHSSGIKTGKCDKINVKNSHAIIPQTTTRHQQQLNNTDYIPYTKLTLGGVNINEIEKEMSNNCFKNDVPLSPILNKMTYKRDSISKVKKQDKRNTDEVKILTTSDENLLQEVLDIEEKVSLTISKSGKSNIPTNENKSKDSENSNNDLNTYADDFEIDNSEDRSEHQDQHDLKLDAYITSKFLNENATGKCTNNGVKSSTSKKLNLSFKDQVDTYEYIHTIDVQDIATQSHSVNRISPKETQTSPRVESSSVQTIHNDLCSSPNPNREIEKMFALEKDFIKKIIIEEYADVIEKSYTTEGRNIANMQKNTQTSPARVKNVMTSPTNTKTRTTSPFSIALTINRETSPMIIMSKDLGQRQEDKNIEQEDSNISINLSSPRFSLRLPSSSRELLRNLDDVSQIKSNINVEARTFRKPNSSSSSIDGDYSSSDISSLGEINRQYKRRLRRHKMPSVSELSSLSKYSSDPSEALPQRSDGEISLKQLKKSNKASKSEGELSLGQLK